uniref:LysM domain-containing protein n=1 Tax=Leersia perrieri TaxID=77586 RepID=A0A0D9V6I2_9ORYZ
MANLKATALLLAFLFIAVAIADGRSLSVADVETYGAHQPAPTAPLICTMVHGVEAGETCDSISRRFQAGLGRAPFLRFISLNPNINCRELFVGQWVCLRGLLPA